MIKESVRDLHEKYFPNFPPLRLRKNHNTGVPILAGNVTKQLMPETAFNSNQCIILFFTYIDHQLLVKARKVKNTNRVCKRELCNTLFAAIVDYRSREVRSCVSLVLCP